MHTTPAYSPIAPLESTRPRAITVNASLFRASRGKEPQGHGWWLFDFYSTGQCVERHWRFGGEYSRALDAARAHARGIGASGAELLP